MNRIVFFDTEIDPNKLIIKDLGGIKSDGTQFHKSSLPDFIQFLGDVQFLCGHNILKHDLSYLQQDLVSAGIQTENSIDTLYLSPLLFPSKPYHALLKDDKLQTEELNNPLNDSKKARDLFYDELEAFERLEDSLKSIYFLLLKDQKEFKAFFQYINYSTPHLFPEELIYQHFKSDICQYSHLKKFVSENPIELAYSLALINSFIRKESLYSITPRWVLKNYPQVEQILFLLRNKACVSGCLYCNQALDIYKGLQSFFGFNAYRRFGGEPLQEKAVKAAVNHESILAVFPTGGGKSITFQVPALMSGENMNGLSIVISPLQSLMKDQVDNLERQGITRAVTINGLLDPIEKAKSIERVEDGSASILYLSPESLRSKTIERLILGRKIARFIIDEAHCFSSWGQDFRVDYLYIGDFIQSIQKKKNLQESIPVSCFTATAKQKVIEDIRDYFKTKLDLDLKLFTSKVSRTNLHYKVFEKIGEEDKYQQVRDLIEEKNCPTIIYVSRTHTATKLAKRLSEDGLRAKAYHGKMDSADKSANQNSFIAGEISIMVATSAFGMGVDKKDVGLVVHYEISDSLENYIQEAGRAGRDEKIQADCFVLFNEEDLSKHFILLNQTKLSIKEIQQIWKAIKEITRFRASVSNSALEIARKAGWDDNVIEIETRVTSAIAALEEAGYLKRGQNMPKVFANSILTKNAQEAIDKINASDRIEEKLKEKAVRIIRKLFSSKSRKHSDADSGESRVDYISDHLGIVKEEVIRIINLLREEKILADAKDLSAFIKKGENKNRSLNNLNTYLKFENFLLPQISQEKVTLHIKELNESAETAGCDDINTNKIKRVLNFWSIKNWILFKNLDYSKNHYAVQGLISNEILQQKIQKLHDLSIFILDFLFSKSKQNPGEESDKEEILVELSIQELKTAYEANQTLFKQEISLDDIENALFYLSKIDSLKIEGGFLISYNRLSIERLEQDNKKRYTKEDYGKLEQFYENKVQQIHIVGEYARKMIQDYRQALQFVDDYFQLNYSSFLRQYFPGSKADELKLKMTPFKFKQLFGELSATQLSIINDNESKHLVVAAGPGSGKTKVLVHKLASLLLMEDVKHEQLLMLTFSRAASTEFKKRLIKLIGNAAYYVEIKTFHAYCFDLLGRVGNLEKSNDILKKTIEKIKLQEVEISKITKTVLVIDEAQDMDENEFGLVKTLMELNEEMRVIAVGDDDQNIFEFRGSSSKYLEEFIFANRTIKHELVENFRSRSNLVQFSNQFVTRIKHRLKSTPIVARQKGNGRIQIYRYRGENLMTALIKDLVSTKISGTVGVLCRSNEEALQINGLLIRQGIPSKLIQSNEGFNLFNLVEIRYFLSRLNTSNHPFLIPEDIWEQAKKKLQQEFSRSNKLELVMNLLQEFEITHTLKKYKSDLESYINDSKMEDFYTQGSDFIIVSTIHKAKGREFDTVILLLENFIASSEEAKRQLYVALTRAKENLIIHTNTQIFDQLEAENLARIEREEMNEAPGEIVIQLTLKDVWLGYFENSQGLISSLQSGDRMKVEGGACRNSNGMTFLKFSKRFNEQIEKMQQRGYEIREARVNYIIFWQGENSTRELKILLPEIYFERIKAKADNAL